jgi:uncharacterized membrane protein (Fun14 family)
MTSIFFAPLGAKAAHNINGKKLKKGFALFLLLLGVFVLSISPRHKSSSVSLNKNSCPWLAANCKAVIPTISTLGLSLSCCH